MHDVVEGGRQLGPEVLDYVQTRYARLQERLSAARARPYVFSHGNVFPNFSLIGGQTALRGWLFYLIAPRGQNDLPNERIEMTVTIVDKPVQ